VLEQGGCTLVEQLLGLFVLVFFFFLLLVLRRPHLGVGVFVWRGPGPIDKTPSAAEKGSVGPSPSPHLLM
ncbi:hypothetical protein ACWGIN_13245, partial [Streptomyces sp. NPDC054861]